MAQSPNRSGRGANNPPRGTGGGGRRRTPAPQVKKPFPWGVAATAGILGLLLLGIIAYAVMNQGSGFVTALDRADKSVSGLKVFKGIQRTHVATTVKYDQTPPVGGPHNSIPQTCQVYTAAIANEHAVHSLEHGAVWVTYRPDLPAGEIKALAGLVQGDPYRMLSPYPGQKAPISLQAWARQVTVSKPDDKRVKQFLDAYTSGPQAPERGSACSGTTETGPLRTSTSVTTTASTAPSP
jgi:hypothetical protein